MYRAGKHSLVPKETAHTTQGRHHLSYSFSNGQRNNRSRFHASEIADQSLKTLVMLTPTINQNWSPFKTKLSFQVTVQQQIQRNPEIGECSNT